MPKPIKSMDPDPKIQIWKYKLRFDDVVEIQMPNGAEVLSTGNQHEDLCVWVRINIDKELVTKRFYVVGTGHPFPSGAVRYLGSVQFNNGYLVYHVFEGAS